MPASRTLSRDTVTWFIYLQMSVFATFVYGLSAALPLLRVDLGVSAAVGALHGTAMAAATIVAGLALPFLTRAYGRRLVIWIGLAGMNAGVTLVMLSASLPFTLLGFALAGGFGSVMLYTAMAALSDHHGPAGPAAISEANAIAVVVGVASTFLLSLAAQSALGWRAALLFTPALTALLIVTVGRTRLGEGPAVPARVTGRPDWRFHVACGVLSCCVAIEFCFNLFGAELLAGRTGLSAATAATGLTAFIGGLAIGRFAGARLALRVSPARVLVGALGVTAAGWLLFWLSTQPLVAYAGLVICGLGASMHFPLAMAGVIAASGDRPDLAAAASPVWAGMAMGAGPFALGALADGFGTHTAFLIVPALVAVAVGGVLSARTRA
ncbi:MFS transporter [Nonomuraea recticatena]|uniref:MFS transporter n=3 Tax=Nonomuraea recticatena TaxID=46178 RepID=A0ABP6FL36_9ACTN